MAIWRSPLPEHGLTDLFIPAERNSRLVRACENGGCLLEEIRL
ncbi:MAG: hypothetical protein P1V20_29850 [Verrucomicrobiales bacterium]|nr:hypothetical protein [Verrucomicrobiales bacterium]